MINWWGWRQAVFNLSIIGLMVGAILWGLARQNAPPVMPSSRERVFSKKSDWGIHNARSFSALLTIGIIDIMTRNALLTFLPFLLLRKGISETQIGFALTLLFAGGAAGKFACGLLAERFGIVPMVVGTEILTSLGIPSLTWFSPSGIWIPLPFVGVFLNGTSSVLYATVAEIISPLARSRGYGLYYAITLKSAAYPAHDPRRFFAAPEFRQGGIQR